MSTNTGNVTPDGVAMVMAKGIHVAARHLDGQLAMPGIENNQLVKGGAKVDHVGGSTA